uniref:cytochrome c oxidase subunit III n=1 Tax=Metathelazia capsulata TaxID=2964486 RepID=UPI002E75AEE5|nr:cytochrome c oxidase subunit III [Metathelazia capsulata]WPS93545.1 cytochrome c oxidase subunit III [Metathelazia capsulata]
MLFFRKFHKMASCSYPVYLGFSLLGLEFCFLFFMKFSFFNLFFCITFYLFFLSYLWVKDVVKEEVTGQYSFYDYIIFRQGFRYFLFSEFVLFLTVFWTFLDASTHSLFWVGSGWCPMGILSSNYLGLNALASSFLMMNSQLLKYSRRYLYISNKTTELILLLCIFIGSCFVCFQLFEYSSNCFTITDSIYGSIFYLGTGLHGSHVLIGVIFLIINFFRFKLFHFNWINIQAFDLSMDYWRFLEWMWGFMFCLFYVLGS